MLPRDCAGLSPIASLIIGRQYYTRVDSSSDSLWELDGKAFRERDASAYA